jgi:UDP-N-acetylglucosamine 1-carboxyvinyltransferase
MTHPVPPDRLNCFVVRAGAHLSGTVRISGATKNSGLKQMAAALLAEGTTVLRNVDPVLDLDVMLDVLRAIGAGVEWTGAGELSIDASGRLTPEAPYELVSRMRASINVLGPLVARCGEARVAMPGGDNIGSRKLDMHFRGLTAMGAELNVVHGYIEARTSALCGARVVLEFPSVGATENLLTAGVLAKGTTVIENAAREPEVTDLARLLTAMGARIHGAGTERIEIEGVSELAGARHRVIPDRIEAGTLLVAAAITGGDVTVTGAEPRHMSAMLAKLEEAGSAVTVTDDRIRCQGPARPKAVDLITNPFPGFPTDMQAQFMALLGLADGISKITETIFENRFMHAAELARLGAKIEAEGSTAVVRGQRYYQGAPVMATDLRASASLVLAGLAARGRTEISRVYHLDRGYERLEVKLRSLGATIERLP